MSAGKLLGYRVKPDNDRGYYRRFRSVIPAQAGIQTSETPLSCLPENFWVIGSSPIMTGGGVIPAKAGIQITE